MTDEMLFCKVCRRTQPPAAFYASNRSKCKECVKAEKRAAEAADPESMKVRRRADRQRAKVRAEFGARLAGQMLLGANDVWGALVEDIADLLDAEQRNALDRRWAEAQADWSALVLSAIHDLEDRHGLSPGSGLAVIERIRSERRRSAPGVKGA